MILTSGRIAVSETDLKFSRICIIEVCGVELSNLVRFDVLNLSDSGNQMSDDIKRMDSEEDPNRCQANDTRGQCTNKAVCSEDGEYGEFCLAHGGNRFLESLKKDALRNYRLDKFKARLQRHASAPNIKSLRDEIGILRMTLEERLNRCRDDSDLVLQSGPISDLVIKIDKLVVSCHKLDGSMGQLLDKQAMLQFASEIIEVISTEVEDVEILDRIATKIIGRLNEGVSNTDD